MVAKVGSNLQAGILPVLTILLFVICGRVVQAEILPARGTVDSRIRAAAYDAQQVYRLNGFVGYQIDLEFEPGESFVGMGAGDIDGLAYFGQENHLFLKPKAATVATNLTVLTSRRHYQFEYRSTSARPRAGDPDVIFALRFIYPVSAEQTAAAAAAHRIDADLDNAAAGRTLNFNYGYCGDSTLRPIRASDDGVRTRIGFAANAELPAIFVRADDDTESLINYSMDGGDVIIHRVARRFILRRGKLTGCVVNEGFSGSGSRLESGTVAPTVERLVPGVTP